MKFVLRNRGKSLLCAIAVIHQNLSLCPWILLSFLYGLCYCRVTTNGWESEREWKHRRCRPQRGLSRVPRGRSILSLTLTFCRHLDLLLICQRTFPTGNKNIFWASSWLSRVGAGFVSCWTSKVRAPSHPTPPPTIYYLVSLPWFINYPLLYEKYYLFFCMLLLRSGL